LQTPNWLILLIWPFEASIDRMKRGGHHWAWAPDRKFTMIVVPRNADKPVAQGWKSGEVRSYHWNICMPIHTAAGWEDKNGHILVESSRVHGNAFPFFPADGQEPAMEEATKADFVRWEIDPLQPDGASMPEPLVVLDCPTEFPRIDERFMSRQYDISWSNVFIPQKSDQSKNIFQGLNGLAMHKNSTGDTKWFYAGDDSLIQEPIFIPRTESAPEGDGWVLALIERRGAVSRCDLVVIDTQEFEKPIAFVQLPFHVKAQIHGNWVEAKDLGGYKPIVRQIPQVKISGKGSLEPL
jgi:carotenoid cleavage dioxygenase